MSALAAEEQQLASAPGAVPTLVSDVAAAAVLCRDCGEALRDEDDVLCRWCDDNRSRHPDDYVTAGA